jgi:hypothetical protein
VSTAAADRLAQGEAALLSPAQAARLVGGRRARRWLAEAGLVRRTPLGERVIWGEVLAAMRDVGADTAPKAPAPVVNDLPTGRIIKLGTRNRR